MSEIVPREILEVDLLVAVDVSKCLVHNEDLGWHRQLPKHICVGRENESCNNVPLNAALSDHWHVDYPGLFINETLRIFLPGGKRGMTFLPVGYGQARADRNNASPNACHQESGYLHLLTPINEYVPSDSTSCIDLAMIAETSRTASRCICNAA